MIILLLVFFCISPIFTEIKLFFFRIFSIQEYRIIFFLIHTLCPADRKIPAVKTGQRGVQRQKDRLSSRAFDNCVYHISLGEPGLYQALIFRIPFLRKGMHPFRSGGHGCQRQHPVSVIDMKDLGNRPQLMGGIVFRVPEFIIAQAVMTLFQTGSHFLTKVMHIASPAVNHLAKKPLPYHIQRHKLSPAVTAVLQEHEGGSGPLISLHQIPALPDTVSASHFHSDRNPGLHCLHSYGNMALPCAGNHHILPGQQFPVIRRPCRGVPAQLLCQPGRLFTAVLINITHRRHLNRRHSEYRILKKPVSPVSKSYDSY